MRRTSVLQFALAAALLPVAATAGAQTAEWNTHSYPPDGFSASYPSEPIVRKRNIPTDKGSFELRSYITQDGAATLFIGVCDYGEPAAGRGSDTLLQGAKNGALQNSGSHVISERKIELGIYQGIEFEAENEQMHFSARFYMVGTTLYQTLVVSPLDKPYADTARFLDSFQLVARPAG